MVHDSSLISVQNLRKYFPVTRGLILLRVKGYVKAVDDISFNLARGETLGLVGESGCGKSTTANLLLGLEVPTSGKIFFEGKEITGLKERELFGFRRDIQAVFQDPFRSLNPRQRIKHIIAEPLVVHKVASRKEISTRVCQLMETVGLASHQAELYPHEFSGGQRQRIAIARALAMNPKAILLDEPVSALDVSIKAQILNLLLDLQNKFHLTYLIISHDLAVVEHISTRIGVMYLGKLVEFAPGDELYSNPLHPYTRALLDSIPVADPTVIRETSIEGEVPSPLNPPEGCRFHPRCSNCESKCSVLDPSMREIAPDHFVACHLI